MSRYTLTIRSLIPLIAIAGLTACGKPQAKQAEVPVKKGVYVSTLDCVNSAELPFEQCSDAIELAVKIHNKKLKQHSSLRACEITEGEGLCERSHENKFRRTVVAYLVTTQTKSKAEPLYAPNKRGQMAFRDRDDKSYASTDLTIEFSDDAVSLMETQAATK